jgi:hypothetical protein
MPLHLPALRFVLLQLCSVKGLATLDRARFRSLLHGAGSLRCSVSPLVKQDISTWLKTGHFYLALTG